MANKAIRTTIGVVTTLVVVYAVQMLYYVFTREQATAIALLVGGVVVYILAKKADRE